MPDRSPKVAGSAILVVGATSGLGEAAARHLASLGAKVGIFGRNRERASVIAAETGGLALAGDVTDGAALGGAMDRLINEHGPLRAVVCCAGIQVAGRIVGRSGPMPLATFSSALQTNLVGSFNALRLGAERMMNGPASSDGQRGVVVLTSSVASHEGQVGQVAYAASKGGIEAMIMPATREFAGAGIRVMGIAPGIFDTPLVQTLSPDIHASLSASIPNPPRFGSGSEFAELVETCITNSYLNGTVIRLDGGTRLGWSR